MTNQTTAKYNIDDIDDLTRFADENFDMNEVDLLRFSDNESSPITSLKSVILSLDWDITDEYLQDLADELANLVPDCQGNKIASIYLQGMDKIGRYLRLRGAHAHPNSIKLLLTFFHHFEIIISSSDISDERITALAQSDVRKFKVLQYQIKLAEEAAGRGDGQASASMGLSESRDIGKTEDVLRKFKAAILELDWEVSDDSLARFAAVLQALSQEKIQNRAAYILLQGLQALGQYIADERAKAHPEAFNLLHAFHDGLEQVLDEGPNAPHQRQQNSILVDRVNRLNHLKKLIASKDTLIPEPVPIPKTAPAPDAEEILIDEIDADLHSNFPAQDILQAEPAEPVADSLDFASSSEELDGSATDVISSALEEDLFLIEDDALSAMEVLPPANARDTGQAVLVEGFSSGLDMEEQQPAEKGIESEIDELFAASSKRTMLSAEEEYPIEELPAHAYYAVDDELGDGFIEDNVGTRSGIIPALAGISEGAGFYEGDEVLDPVTKTDLDEQLNSFFGESGEGAEQAEPAACLFDEVFEQTNADEVILGALAATEDHSSDLRSDEDQTPPVSSGPALADVPVPPKTAVWSEEGCLEIEQLLNSFLEDKPDPSAAFNAHAEVSTDNDPLLFSEPTPGKQTPEPADALFTEPVAMGATGNQELQLEKTISTQPASAGQFEDILDSTEVQEFLLSGQNIENIPDEGLEFTDEDTDSSVEEVLFSNVSRQADQAAVEGPIAEAASETVQGSKTYTDLTRLDADETFAATIVGSANLVTGDLVLADRDSATATASISAAIIDVSDATGGNAEPKLHNHDDFSLDAAIAALGAALPNLLNNFSMERLSTARQVLQSIHTSTQLSPVQAAAANMLKTVLVGLPSRHASRSDSSAAAVDSLYQALMQPQEHLPLKAVTTYANWVQTLFSEDLLDDTDEAAVKEYCTARDIYQELSEFRAQVEKEFVQLRQEIKNK